MLKRENKTDVIVVGAGPGGISCAITLARAGKEVVLIERGLFAGSKNVFGGAIYTQPTKEIFPNFEQEAPLERKNIEHNYMILGKSDSTTILYLNFFSYDDHVRIEKMIMPVILLSAANLTAGLLKKPEKQE